MILRRSRFLSSGTIALGSAFALHSPARAAEFEYKLAHPDPIELPQHVRAVQMCNAIKAETNGRMSIHVFPNGMLGSQTGMLGQLREGSIQFLMMLDSAYAPVVPVAAISSVGFAFSNPQQPARLFDGPLGAYVRKEFAAKGLFVFERILETGLRQVTSSTKPIRTADDLVGFKIRTPPTRIYVDLFKTLGASPVPLDSNLVYVSLQTHVVDGQETPYQAVDAKRLFEVQRYLSVTNHIWSGYWFAGNMDAWNALPPDIRDVVSRNAQKYMLLERRDMYQLNDALPDKLKREGMVFNDADTATMRARLKPYYARWKAELGTAPWDLLEASVGKLG